MESFTSILARTIFMVLPMILLTSCGQSLESGKFFDAARRQFALDNEMMMLFERGPTWDGSNPGATAKQNLQSIPKSFVPLYGLSDIMGPLRGFLLNGFGYGIQVQYSNTNNQSPIFGVWAGQNLQWDSKEFKAFMLYAHMSRAYTVVFDNMLSIQGLVDQSNYPVRGLAAKPGSILGTSFTYAQGQLALNFYQHNQDTSLKKLNMVDEADAIYHEYAHYIQHIYNDTALNVPISNIALGAVVNPDLDAIIEGTADYFAAAMTKSERIHVYLENNLPLVRGNVKSRDGFHNRSISRSWRFPDTYIFQSHMDGRVVAAAVNDIRKFISKQDVALSGCVPASPGDGSCVVSSGVNITGVNDLWIKAFEISMLAFRDLATTSTHRHYARRLVHHATQFLSTQGCAGGCLTDARADLVKILQFRGLLDADEDVPGDVPAYTVGSADTKVLVSPSFNFVPFDPARNLSDTNGKLSECEIAIIFPDIINNTASPESTDHHLKPATDFYNIHFRVLSTQNLQEVKDGSQKIIEYLSGENRIWKYWGTLKPGQRGLTNVATSSSDWYKSTNGSHFSKPPTLENFPVPWGYMISVPQNRLGEVMSVTWEVRMTPKYTDTTAAQFSFQVTQSLTIDEDLTFPCAAP
jgi:hypothetical protein